MFMLIPQRLESGNMDPSGFLDKIWAKCSKIGELGRIQKCVRRAWKVLCLLAAMGST
jgi:hypothetical protein